MYHRNEEEDEGEEEEADRDTNVAHVLWGQETVGDVCQEGRHEVACTDPSHRIVVLENDPYERAYVKRCVRTG